MFRKTVTAPLTPAVPQGYDGNDDGSKKALQNERMKTRHVYLK